MSFIIEENARTVAAGRRRGREGERGGGVCLCGADGGRLRRGERGKWIAWRVAE